MLRLRQVFARTSDRDSRIADDRDDREPRFYQRQMLVDHRDEDQGGAWSLDSKQTPFGFEYLQRATFREVNFGRFDSGGASTVFAGREAVRPGFVICLRCGKVQKDAEAEAQHTYTCPTRKGTASEELEPCLYLYREFSSEALRLLLPLADVGTTRQRNSFLAALQLGLREHFRGRVDHIHSTVYSEPVPDSPLRRQYLVLFDTVPGGTGYLKQLVHGDDPAQLPLYDVLRAALARLETCSCWNDAERDGCYRCLLQYRNSRDMDDTSARTGAELLRRILAERSRTKPIGSLGEVSITGLMDSILEARFVEALRQARVGGRRSKVSPAVVRGKPGWRIQLADAEWTLEPQVDQGAADGLPVVVSIDFVLRRAGAAKEGELPIAVFLDGWQFHRDRIGHDLLQRQVLLASGRWDVWSLTWSDMDKALGLPGEKASNLVHENLAELRQKLVGFKLAPWKDAAEKGAFDLLIAHLAAPEPIPWERLGMSLLASRMTPAGASATTAWDAGVERLAPVEIRAVLRGATFQLALADGGDLDPRVEIHAGYGSGKPTAIVSLDDPAAEYESSAMRRAWQGLLHLFQLLRHVPGVWFFTSSSRDTELWGSLALLREPPAEAAGVEAWAEHEDLDEDFRSLARGLAEAGVPEPEIGMEVPDRRGGTWAEAELLWESARAAVITARARDDALGQPAEGWTVFVREELDGPDAVLDALREA